MVGNRVGEASVGLDANIKAHSHGVEKFTVGNISATKAAKLCKYTCVLHGHIPLFHFLGSIGFFFFFMCWLVWFSFSTVVGLGVVLTLQEKN